MVVVYYKKGLHKELAAIFPTKGTYMEFLSHLLAHAAENGMEVTESLDSQMIQKECKEILKQEGFYTKNLWSVEDVKSKFDCTDREAHSLLHKTLTNESTMNHIWEAMEIVGDIEGLAKVKQ